MCVLCVGVFVPTCKSWSVCPQASKCVNACVPVCISAWTRCAWLSCTSISLMTHTQTHSLPASLAHPSIDHPPPFLLSPCLTRQQAVPTSTPPNGMGTARRPCRDFHNFMSVFVARRRLTLAVPRVTGGGRGGVECTGRTDWFGMPDRASPAPLSIYLGAGEGKGKGRENVREGGRWSAGWTMWRCLAPGRALKPGQLAQTDSLSFSPSANTGSLVRADSFHIAGSISLCVG